MKRSWIKKKRKSERQLLIDVCDELVRQIVRLRDKICQYSRKTENLEVSHFISRENIHLRWNLDNVVLINGGIHAFTFHKYPAIHRDFMIARIGLEKVEKFEMMSRVRTRPLYTCEIKIIRDMLKQELKKWQRSY